MAASRTFEESSRFQSKASWARGVVSDSDVPKAGTYPKFGVSLRARSVDRYNVLLLDHLAAELLERSEETAS